MGILEILLIGLGLSMDAAAVSLCNGMACVNLTGRRALVPPLFFGLFQGLMPILGYLLMSLFSEYFIAFSELLTFIILCAIGVNMIREGLKKEEGAETRRRLKLSELLMQALSTSIDAFAVGVGFGAMQVDILFAGSAIAVITFVCSLIAILLGKRFGSMLGCKAELLGGAILILIGIRALF